MDGRDLFFPYTNFPGFYSYPLPAKDFYPHQFWQVIGPEPAAPENQSASQSSACESPCTSNAIGSPDSLLQVETRGKKSHKKWSEEEKSLLVHLWAENFDYLESKDDRKVWELIANGNFVLSRKQQAICCNYLSIFPSAKQKQAVDFVVVE